MSKFGKKKFENIFWVAEELSGVCAHPQDHTPLALIAGE